MNANIDLSNVILKTKRLILRPFTFDDLDDFYEYAKVPGIGKLPVGIIIKITGNHFLFLICLLMRKTFAIEYEGKVIGSLGIEEYDEKLFPDLENKLGRSLGFVLSKDYWGLGLMPEAVKEVIRYCFDDLKLDF